jgi:hypothetical protein
VNPDIYDILRIWTRGRSQEDHRWLQRFRARLSHYTKPMSQQSSRSLNNFTRVFVAVRFKSEKKLHLKVFKDVACDKMEHLLPDGKIKMSEYDKWFLGGSVLVGSVLVGMRSLPVLENYHLNWTWVGLGLVALTGTRAWVGYRNKRNKYLANLAATLYFKTVANNRGVLTLLADRAVDEEFKEAFLAYVFLLSPRNRRGIPGTAHTALPPSCDTPEELRLRIEGWLEEQYQLRGFRFDVEDSLSKLSDLGLLVRHPDHTLSVLGLKVSCLAINPISAKLVLDCLVCENDITANPVRVGLTAFHATYRIGSCMKYDRGTTLDCEWRHCSEGTRSHYLPLHCSHAIGDFSTHSPGLCTPACTIWYIYSFYHCVSCISCLPPTY